MTTYQEDIMTPAAAAEVAITIRTSFDWPSDAEIVAFRPAAHNLNVTEFAVVLPGANDEQRATIEWCFRNGVVFEGQRRPYHVVVFPDRLPSDVGWIEVSL